MTISKSKREFEDFFERKYGDNSQLVMDFDEK